MEGFESFKPSSENKRARDEEAERISMQFHNRDLHDEEGSHGIDEVTGVQDTTPEVDGADESRREKSVKKRGKSEDLMGPVSDALPENPNDFARWVEKEKQRLEKKKGFKKAA